MDPAGTADALSYGSSRGGSGIVIRRGQRVGYWGGQAALYDIKSSTKSFGSLLLAVALADPALDLDLDTLVQPLLPELGVPQPTPTTTSWLSLVKVRHLANQSSGFPKTGGFGTLQFKPGTRWLYSDGAPNWLADLLTVLYQQDLNLVMRSRVLLPMEIAGSQLVWRSNAYRPPTLKVNGADIARREFGSGISTSVDLMATVGLMLLRDGRWKTTRILPAGYAKLAGTPDPSLAGLPCVDSDPKKCPGATDHYGLLFWNNADGHLPGVPADAYWAAGQYTSFIIVVPSLDLVTARAGTEWPGPADQNVVLPYIAKLVSAVKGSSTLVSRVARGRPASMP
jgi:CubicO group peptidase (beta-lactamase class C family)